MIYNLFPTPLYVSNLNKKFTEKELNFVLKQKNHCINNDGNKFSKDTYILNNQELVDIKTLLEKSCKDYLNNIICTKDDIELNITQSWLNYTEENEYHHRHHHPNSIVSGVLYFDCDEKNDRIKFFSEKPKELIKPKVEYNTWNAENSWFAVKTGDLFMFPSYIDHQVDLKKGSHTRISLSFNTFFKGTIGGNDNLNKLIIQ